MSKNIPIRYLSEDAVKHVLKIDSFHNMPKDKIFRFASMLPYMDKEVAIAIIGQFPAFVDFGNTVILYYSQVCDKILENNKEDQKAVVHGYQTILDSLSKRLESENITDEELRYITEQMIIVADKIAECDLQNKKFLDRLASKFVIGGLIVFGIIAAGIGITSALGDGEGSSDLDDDDDYDEFI